MNPHIRVLCIAPYDGMKSLMAGLAEEYPQFDLSLFVGDREHGLEIAKSNFHGNYDVVISRGGTADMLRQNLSIPVVEIETSMYDILYALKLTDGLTGKAAMVSTGSIAKNARRLCDLMGYDLDIFIYESNEDMENILLNLQKERYQAILGDMVANTTAQRLGMNSLLITSSLDSIRKAFDQALMLCQSQQHLRDENQFFREVIQGQIGQTLVFDSDGNLFLSTMDAPRPELLELLRWELPESRNEMERRIIRNVGGMLYSIRARRIDSGSLSYIAFYVDTRKTPLSPNQVGIRFSTRPEAESAFYNSIFSFAGTIGELQDDIDKISQSTAPAMVTGEDGTGKEFVVGALYMRSQLKNNPLITINCSLLNDKSWTFLLEHHNSPLADEGNTLYFASIDVLTQERRQQLLAALLRQHVNAGKIQGIALVRQRGVVVLQQEGPALVVQQAAIDGDQRVVFQLAPHIQRTHHKFLAGAVLSGDHGRCGALADLVDVVLKLADGARKAENTVVKGALRLRPCGKPDAHLIGRQRRLPGVHIERDVGEAPGVDPPRPDGIQHPPHIPDDAPLHLVPGLRQLPPQ